MRRWPPGRLWLGPDINPMRFLFRADASLAIGTGHVMRCATLAIHLVEAGHDVRFLCRETPGNLNNWLKGQGVAVTRLAELKDAETEASDAGATKTAIGSAHFDWLVVDHYSLGVRWERAVADRADRILAIDDLGREHDCYLLLDQNYQNPVHANYRGLASAGRTLLLGPEFALVRPEFAKLRPRSLARQREALSRVIVFMGGSDPHNETTKALGGIALANLTHLSIDVVIGSSNPHRPAVEAACAQLASAELHVQTPRMADLMAAADCAIGAGGSATWERCVLGLPALVTILADNQIGVAEGVDAAGGHQLLGRHEVLTAEDYAMALVALDGKKLSQMSLVAADICDGQGTERVVASLSKLSTGTTTFSGKSHGR
jgi:UDP-2,4-diacetamido-2,4,6-trideoxy-beta-L-altropyranose hydrolase